MSSSENRPAPRRSARTRLSAALAAAATVAVAATATFTGTVTTAAPAAAAACSSSNFKDVPRASTWYSPVTWMSCQGIAKGYANGTFGVDAKITRGEVATMLYRQVTPQHPKDGKQYFTDVRRGQYYTDAVNWMAQAGLSTGYADRSFRPNQPISRGEVSALLYRLAGSRYAGPATSYFRDMGKAHPFYAEASWMRNQGLISGYADWRFRPERPITRGETAKMLTNSHRLIAHRGDVSTPVMKPLPVTVEHASSTIATWKKSAADWATKKARSSSTYYQYGGNGPSAYDCSGFTTGAFSAAGKSLPRVSKSQYSAADQHVPLGQAQTGDLVYWSNNGSASGVYHVAIVVGNGQIAHARNPQEGVTLTDIDYSPRNMLSVAGRFH